MGGKKGRTGMIGVKKMNRVTGHMFYDDLTAGPAWTAKFTFAGVNM